MLDDDGDAWQRSIQGWLMAGARDPRTWDELLTHFGVRTVIYDPATVADAA
ncbi:hypothetical protein [Nonomuraea sp. NPDC052265]|uniref:hypothetical protein n=1 Tax=Nonomuraea sp. NPDC052265 TaxID=3364374 RepID=UPI0037C74132